MKIWPQCSIILQLEKVKMCVNVLLPPPTSALIFSSLLLWCSMSLSLSLLSSLLYLLLSSLLSSSLSLSLFVSLLQSSLIYLLLSSHLLSPLLRLSVCLSVCVCLSVWWITDQTSSTLGAERHQWFLWWCQVKCLNSPAESSLTLPRPTIMRGCKGQQNVSNFCCETKKLNTGDTRRKDKRIKFILQMNFWFKETLVMNHKNQTRDNNIPGVTTEVCQQQNKTCDLKTGLGVWLGVGQVHSCVDVAETSGRKHPSMLQNSASASEINPQIDFMPSTEQYCHLRQLQG